MTESSSIITQYTLLSGSSSGGNKGGHSLLSQEAKKNDIEEANEIAWATLVSPTDLHHSDDDDDLPTSTIKKTVDPKYANHIKEAQKLAWTDDYFDDDDDDDEQQNQQEDEGIIAVFDFDYEAMEQYYTDIGWAVFAASIFIKPLFLASMAGLYPCFLRKNVRWQAQAQHVAITEDGIRFVREQHSSCWGLACTDRGRVSKTVPFDMISDCEVHEPAGNTCLCIPNVLTVVNLETACSGVKNRYKIAGLKDPHGFQKMVWAMKKRGGVKQNSSGGSIAAQYDDSAVQLLHDIRDELRKNNNINNNNALLLQRHQALVRVEVEPEVAKNVMTRL